MQQGKGMLGPEPTFQHWALGPFIDIWRADLRAAEWDTQDLVALLTPREKARAKRLVVEERKREFATSRLFARRLIATSKWTSGDGAMDADEVGKPYLPEDECTSVSWSRSAPYMALGLSRNQAIGVDIETLRELDASPIIDMICGASEVTQLLNLPSCERLDRFFQVWTMKEAILKCIGTGFQTRAKRIVLPQALYTADPSIPFRLEALDRQFDLYQLCDAKAQISVAVET